MWIVDLIVEILEEEDNEIIVHSSTFYWDTVESIEEALELAHAQTDHIYHIFDAFEPSITDLGDGNFQITLRG
jgi:hypothetical protein